MKNIKGDTGYPTKKYIRHLVKEFNEYLKDMDEYPINPMCVTFSAMYAEEGKRSGILWRNDKSMESMDRFEGWLDDEADISIKRVKSEGQICSIWFSCDI